MSHFKILISLDNSVKKKNKLTSSSSVETLMKMKAEEEEYAEEQEFSVISNNYNLAEHLNKKNVSKLKLKQFYVIK